MSHLSKITLVILMGLLLHLLSSCTNANPNIKNIRSVNMSSLSDPTGASPVIVDPSSKTAAAILNTVAETSDGYYNAGKYIFFNIKFNRIVTVEGNTKSEFPYLILNSSSPMSEAKATYKNGSGTDTLTFKYFVEANQNSSDLNYASASALTLPTGASIYSTSTDTTKISANLTLPILGSGLDFGSSSTIVIDTLPPNLNILSSVPIYSKVTTESPPLTLDIGGDLTFDHFEVTLCQTDVSGTCISEVAVNTNFHSGEKLTGLSLSDATSYLFIIKAFDKAANITNKTSSSWSIDTTLPNSPLVIGAPGDFSNFTNLNITVSTPPAPKDFSFYKYKIGLSTDPNFCTDTGSGYSSSPIDLTSNPIINNSLGGDGKYKLCIIGIDLAGNVSSPTTLSWLKDTVPPDISMMNFQIGEISTSTLALSTMPVLINSSASWPTDSGSGLANYTVYYKNNSTNTIYTPSSTKIIDKILSSSPSGALDNFTRYSYEKIEVYDKAGNLSTISLNKKWNTLHCPDGYIAIPDSSTPDLATGICLAKYEIKAIDPGALNPNIDGPSSYNNNYIADSRANNTPWTNISRNDAASECAALGTNYNLISNRQWQLVAHNIESQNANWFGGTRGSNYLFIGHSNGSPGYALAADINDLNLYLGTLDSPGVANCSDTYCAEQKRTFTLSNKELIWDLAGNVSEWLLDDLVTSGGLTVSSGGYDYQSWFWTAYPKLIFDSGTPGNLSFNFSGYSDNSSGTALSLFGPLGNTITGDYVDLSSTAFNGGLGYATLNKFTYKSSKGLTRGGDYSSYLNSGIFQVQNDYSVSLSFPYSSNTIGFRCAYRPTIAGGAL